MIRTLPHRGIVSGSRGWRSFRRLPNAAEKYPAIRFRIRSSGMFSLLYGTRRIACGSKQHINKYCEVKLMQDPQSS